MSVSEAAGPAALALVRAVASNDSAVSVLIAGETGAGQKTLARILTAAYLCLAPKDGNACGECAACGLFERGASPDVLHHLPRGKSDQHVIHEIVPAEWKKKEPPPVPARSFLDFRPTVSKNRVVIIERAERLNIEASSALLKMLEEPPAWGRFILTSHAASSLMPTIRSRCVLIPCDFPSLSLPPDIDRLSAGASEIAELLMSEKMSPVAAELGEWLRRLPNRKGPEALKVSEEFQALSAAYREALNTGDKEDERTVRGAFITLVANWLSSDARDGSSSAAGLLAGIVEMHRLSLGNVNFAYLSDSMFCAGMQD